MDPEVLSEARDFVTGWIDKAGADGNGVNFEVSSSGGFDLFPIGCMQGSQRGYGPLVRPLLALRHGRRFLLRSHKTIQIYSVHVLRGKDRDPTFQVLNGENR